MKYIDAAAVWIVVLTLSAGMSAAERQQQSPDALMGQALHQEEVEGKLEAAIDTYNRVVTAPGASRALIAQALLHLGQSQEKLGHSNARAAYERITREFADQTQVTAQARSRLAALATGNGTPDTRVVARQVWAGDDVDPYGSPSSDGRLFAFIEWATNPFLGNVAVRDLGTGETRRVTHATTEADGYGFAPALSPDGKQVAYVWEQDAVSIRVASVDGTNSRVLLQKPGLGAYNLRWSPNGRHIAAVLTDFGGDHTSQIVLISTTDGTITQLKSLGWDGAETGGFSPDGRFLVYAAGSSPSSANRGILTIAVDGSREVRLVQSAAKDTSPVWTPDGRRVVFVSDRSGTQDLWSVRVSDGKADGEPELLRANIGDVANMGFTRDGSYFYGTTNQKKDVYVCELDPGSLEVISQPRRLSDAFVGSNAGPAWSPDGRFIAYLRGADRRAMSVVVRAVADGTERTLPTRFSDSIQAGMSGPVWMPDSRSLLLPDPDYAHDVARVRMVDVESGKDQVVLEGQHVWPVAQVSPDGKTLYYTKVEKGENPDANMLHLMAHDIAGAKGTELYRAESPGVAFFGLAVSPDGTQIGFMANEGKGRVLMTVATAGGPRRVLYRGTYSQPVPFGAAWTRDGRYILAFSATDRRRMHLSAFPTDGGDPRPLDIRMEMMSAVNVSPDGYRVVFTGGQSKAEVWTIKNLLPTVAPAIASSR